MREPALEERQDERILLGEPRRRDAAPRLPAAHPELPLAEVEHRRASAKQMNAALFDRDEERDHADVVLATRDTTCGELGEERVVGQMIELHSMRVSRGFSSSPMTRRPRFEASNASKALRAANEPSSPATREHEPIRGIP